MRTPCIFHSNRNLTLHLPHEADFSHIEDAGWSARLLNKSAELGQLLRSVSAVDRS
jgi:hypothetical protein